MNVRYGRSHGGSENSPQPTSNFRGNRSNLIIDLGPNSDQSRVDLESSVVITMADRAQTRRHGRAIHVN